MRDKLKRMMFNKKLVVHIGPPKTASTALQLFLQDRDGIDISYIGVFQRRAKRSVENRDRNLIYNFLNTGSGKKEAKEVFRHHVTDGRVTVFSEEMILYRTNWREKIQRLRECTLGLDIRIIFCVRPCASVLPSYFCETYQKFGQRFTDYTLFEESEHVAFYNYKYLYYFLQETGFDDVQHFYFNDLVSGDVKLSDLCTSLPEKDIVLPRSNSGRKSASGRRMVSHDLYQDLPRVIKRGVRQLQRLGAPGQSLYRALRKMAIKEHVPDIHVSRRVVNSYEESCKFLDSL